MKKLGALSAAVGGANLKQNQGKKEKAKGHRAKCLKRVPVYLFDDHQKALIQGLTALNFSDYMIEATREKLARDHGLPY